MKTTSTYIGALTLGLAAMAVASCSDTWDDHYDTVEESVANETLWEIISNNSELSNFAEVAEQVHYYRDEEHPQESYTFKDMLNGSQIITVWAPTNDALTQQEWNTWKELASTSGYTVQQQLLGNSISLWRQNATGSVIDTLTMINGKKIEFNRPDGTMGGSAMLETNIAASNGILHTVEPEVPFNYNIYEFLKDEANTTSSNLSTFHSYIVENDTTYFSEDNSIEGNPDEDGNPTYVDSVYFTSNNLLHSTHRYPTSTNTDQYLTYNESFGADIDAEDSVFVALLPTDNAWQKAYDMLKPYYNYASVYIDSEKGNNGNSATRTVSDTDSLMEKCINMDIISPLVYNVNMQPNAAGRIGTWEIDDFLANCNQASYILNTFGDTLRSDDTWQPSDLFQGTQTEMSNGVGIISDNWNIPFKLYKPDINIEVGTSAVYNISDFTNSSNTITTVSFSNSTASAWIDSLGRVSHDNFYTFTPRSEATNMNINFKLVGNDQELVETEVMSGKYDIYVVCVPNFYITSSDTIYGDVKLANIGATINYNDGNVDASARTPSDATFSTTEDITYTGEKVDTLLLFEDFEFPVSYKNMLQCYPTLTLTIRRTTAALRREGYSNTINIDRIILKSKED